MKGGSGEMIFESDGFADLKQRMTGVFRIEQLVSQMIG
jgi:hypothetical protein